MAAQGGYNPGSRKENPEQKVDRLIQETEISMSYTSCSDLEQALENISPADAERRTRANNVLKKCRKKGHLK